MSAVASALEHELVELKERISAIDADAAEKKEAADKIVADFRKNGVNPMVDDAAFAQVDAAYRAYDDANGMAAEFRSRLNGRMAEHSAMTPTKARSGYLSIAERIHADSAFASLMSAGAFKGTGQIGVLPPIAIATRDEMISRIKAGLPIFGAGATAEDIIPPDLRLFPPIAIPVRKLRVLDLITVGATGSDLVEYSKQTVRTDAAAAKALRSAYDQATYTWTTAQANVRDIGHYAKAPRSTLSDIGQLQTLIEQNLSYGLERKIEDQVVGGDGLSLNFSGIYTDIHTGNYFITRDTTNERRLIALHRAVTAVRLSAFDEPTAIGIHPTDFHELIAEESSAGGFLMAATALAQEQPSLWGLPVVATAAFTENEPVVGNYKAGATLWVREGASIRISDSNEDDFLTRQIAILGEVRAAYATVQPKEFCSVKSF